MPPKFPIDGLLFFFPLHLCWRTPGLPGPEHLATILRTSGSDAIPANVREPQLIAHELGVERAPLPILLICVHATVPHSQSGTLGGSFILYMCGRAINPRLAAT